MAPKFLLPLLIVPALATAQAASAGTMINNQASATYQLAGQVGAVNSPAAQVTVNAVCRVLVTPDGTVEAPGQEASPLPGQRVTFTYQVSNTGNSRSTFDLLAQTEAGSTFAPKLQIIDENPINTLTLDAGASATVRLLADVTGERGAAAVNLIASCPNGGAQDRNNVARVRVTPPPALSLSKSFSTERLRPGDRASVTVTATNKGSGAAQNVTLTDPLAAQVEKGLQYVSGSASASSGTLEFTANGSSWTTSEPANVQGVRVVLATLAAGGQATLSFGVVATAQAENQTFVNVADLGADYGGGAEAQATLDVRYAPSVALGPIGNATAPDGTPADTQSQPFALVNQASCFDHTLQNMGDVADTFTFAVSYLQGQASASYFDEGGQPLVTPLRLEAGAGSTVRVCYTPQVGSTAMQATLTAVGARGTRNATTDTLARIESQYPTLVKTVARAGHPNWTPNDTVTKGDTLIYTLSVTNPYTLPLHDVTVSDPIPAHLDDVIASDGGQVSGVTDTQVVTWQVGMLAAGQTRTFTVQAKVSARTLDDETLRNVFNMTSSELIKPVKSNEATAFVWNAPPFIAKKVDLPVVAPGDRVTYTLTLKNTSSSSALVDVRITDTPAAALHYVPGSSLLDGVALGDPTIQNGSLTWTVPRLEADKPRNLSYQLRVLPGASGDLINSVVMVGRGEKANATAIASNQAKATTKVQLLNFAPVSDILGTVFVDRNGDGQQGDNDRGVSGARVVLAGGKVALTDAQGRYHFANVPLGTQALRLDPSSVPAQPQGSGTVTVQVQGLTTVDFPLSAANAVTALRDIELQAGSLSLHKAVTPTPTGYRVTLTLTTPAALGQLDLIDPLPGDARLRSGQHSWSGPLSAGTTTLVYDFDWSGDPAGAVTDPVIRLGSQP